MRKKEKSFPSHESQSKNVSLTTPQRNLPSSENSPWVAFLCPQLLVCTPLGPELPSEVHPEPPAAVSAVWHCQAAIPGGRHQDRAQNILISFKWTFLSHTVISFWSFLSWKRATPRGCLSLLLLTPQMPVTSLSLLRERGSQQTDPWREEDT